jgi:hypothetical protein
MRKVLLGLVAAGTALAAASPAAAQYYPGQPAYGAPYGHAYGYNAGWGQVRALQVRIDAVERQIRVLDRRDRIRDDRADRLRAEANEIERQLHRRGRNGLSPYEANEISARIARLEQRVQYAVANNYGRYGNRGWSDRDRDGRNDRYEDDHGWRHDR